MKVMNLWRVECRHLRLCAAERTKFSLHIATKEIHEKGVVRKIKSRFTHEWWDEVLILDVIEIGKLHMIEDKALYEDAE